MIDVLLYQRKGGRSPFADWFDDLDQQAAAKVTVALERMRTGNLSHLKSIGGGVQEYRLNWGPGYRIYLGRDGDRVVILRTGGTKQRQDHDITAAKACWADYNQRRS